ncbi:hypothetical protein Peur_055663 [Populus x canadensis]
MPTTGLCPICRTVLKKTDLITCPTENKFRVDFEKNWEESSKVSKLLECLEHIRRSGSGENKIVFRQWTYFFDLLEITLRRRGTELLRFDGERQQKQRERVLKKFSETKEKTDPWWNPAVEEQAIIYDTVPEHCISQGHGGGTPARSSSKEVTHDFRRPHHQGSPVSEDRKAGNAVLP